jgi:hypothetical protein
VVLVKNAEAIVLEGFRRKKLIPKAVSLDGSSVPESERIADKN